MTPFERIQAVRRGGVVRGGVLHQGHATAESLAAMFDLRRDPDIYVEIQADRAIDILTNVIRRDLAYGFEFTTEDNARALALEFMQGIRSSSKRYFTNGQLGWPDEPPSPGRTWTPATDATFDTGVLIVGDPSSACLWVQDED